MNARLAAVGLALIALAAAPATNGRPAQERVAPPPRVDMPGTQLLHLPSRTIGRDFDLCVNLPGSYGDTGRRYPVIFLLDAQWDFPLVASIYGQQYFDGFIPAAIVVGITWGGENPKHDSLRAGDLSPTHNRQIPQSGNGPEFLSFIRHEVVPLVDSAYRTTGDRTLMGSSFGGLFTLYALFHDTGLFNRYVLTSPYIGWDNGAIYAFEREYAGKRAGTPVRVYMASGELEEGTPLFRKFAAHLDSARHPGLDLTTGIIGGMGHSGSKAEGYTRGLQAVFERPSLDLGGDLLAEYTGEYETASGMTITVFVEGGRLTVRNPDGSNTVLHAESGSDFYARGSFLRVHFLRDGGGKVSGCRVERYGGEQTVKKIR